MSGRVAVVLLLLAVAGCGSGQSASGADVAAAFEQAISSKNGAAACGLLSPTVVKAVAETGDASCAEAIIGLGLTSAPVVDAQMFGRQAFVTTRKDSLFLSEFPQGWRVIAAGCEPQGDKPYDCLVSGGS